MSREHPYVEEKIAALNAEGGAGEAAEEDGEVRAVQVDSPIRFTLG